MLEIELELPMNVGVINAAQHAPLLRHLLVKRGSRDRRVQHELMKVGIMRHRVLDLRHDVVGRVVLEADDGGSLDANAVLAQFPRQFLSLSPLQLVVGGLRRFQAHPEP